jgi:hypothetical protein
VVGDVLVQKAEPEAFKGRLDLVQHLPEDPVLHAARACPGHNEAVDAGIASQ